MIDYLAEARACRTENQFNRLHIRLEDALAPAEIAAIGAAAADAQAPEASRAWIAGLVDKAPGLFETPEPFARREVRDQVAFFGGPAPASGRKRLLVAFTGKVRRMMLPTAMFLQAIDARTWDVVLLKRRRSFFEGMAGVADDFDGLVAYLRRDFATERYESVTTLGTSSGGGIAIVAALKLGARRGVSISGVTTEDLMAAAPRRAPFAALLKRGPSLRYVYAADFPADEAAADEMARAWGGRKRPVRGVAGHNVMWPLQKRNELKALLEEVM